MSLLTLASEAAARRKTVEKENLEQFDESQSIFLFGVYPPPDTQAERDALRLRQRPLEPEPSKNLFFFPGPEPRTWPIALPPAEPCPICEGALFWLNPYGKLACGGCFPPKAAPLVRLWLDLLLTNDGPIWWPLVWRPVRAGDGTIENPARHVRTGASGPGGGGAGWRTEEAAARKAEIEAAVLAAAPPWSINRVPPAKIDPADLLKVRAAERVADEDRFTLARPLANGCGYTAR